MSDTNKFHKVTLNHKYKVNNVCMACVEFIHIIHNSFNSLTFSTNLISNWYCNVQSCKHFLPILKEFTVNEYTVID